VVFVIDLEHELILDKVVFPAIALAVVFSLFEPDPSLGDALLGGAVGFGIMLLLYLVFRGGFGEGDVKFAALMGLMTGFPLIFAALLLSIVGGGIVASVILASGIRRRGEAIPFGPFLATGTMITLLWGQAFWDWYSDLIGI
jgi:leader peptidase (prepilin peptidase)/N-methyltransferase